MESYCLIGNPLKHSVSPFIHQKLFGLSGKEGRYTLLEIPPEEFESRAGRLTGFSGFNVTIPYKQRILPMLSEISPRAERYGAVNTVKNENGRLKGYNTDAEGFLRALSQAGIRLSGNVLLCGAGGAAAMMACEALEHGCQLTAAARSYEKADAFLRGLAGKYPDARVRPALLSDVGGNFDLILNATPCGMYPHAGECPLPERVIRSAGAVFDAIYNPGDTLLLKRAAASGAKVQGGLPMLVWQAAAAQEIWTGARFRQKDVAALCRETENIIQRDFR